MKNQIIAVDVGGTNLRVALFDEKQQKLDYAKFNTDPNSPENSFMHVADFINKHKANLKAVGISVPGPTNYDEGYFYWSTNLAKWSDFRFFEFLRKQTNFSAFYSQNDANLMALAHHYYFKATIRDITQFFTISTGLGAGLIVKNEVFVGTNDLAQEVAFAPTAWVKKAGKNLGEGSVEYFASGSGLEVRAKEAKVADSAKELFANYHTNALANEIIDEGIEALANMIAISGALVNPSMMIFDGSVARHNRWYVEKAIERARPRMFDKQWLNIKFLFGELGDDAALIGAFYLARDKSDKK